MVVALVVKRNFLPPAALPSVSKDRPDQVMAVGEDICFYMDRFTFYPFDWKTSGINTWLDPINNNSTAPVIGLD